MSVLATRVAKWPTHDHALESKCDKNGMDQRPYDIQCLTLARTVEDRYGTSEGTQDFSPKVYWERNIEIKRPRGPFNDKNGPKPKEGQGGQDVNEEWRICWLDQSLRENGNGTVGYPSEVSGNDYKTNQCAVITTARYWST